MAIQNELFQHMGHKDQDNLIAGVFPRAHTTGGTLRKTAEAAEYPRGTILAESSKDGKLVILGTTAADGETLTPAFILKDTVQVGTEADEAVVVYHTGNFNPAAVTVAADYEVTAVDKDTLRRYGIVFTQML